MTTPPPIADQLREAIRASGRSYRELSKAADLSPALVSRFMNEPHKSINTETAEALARALGIKVLKVPPA